MLTYAYFLSNRRELLVRAFRKKDPPKGRHPLKKVANFRALPKLAKPHPPIRATWSSFFPDVKTTFYAYDRKKLPMMIMMIAMIIMIVMKVILMIMMTKMTKKNIQML